MWSEPSAMVWCDALNDGASVPRIWFTSPWPVSSTSWEVITSTGTGVSTAVRDVRAPTTTTSDRKSTRLNSSHGYISYAVFCLKKKKIELYVVRDAVRHAP